jgi:hypothetical protein
MFAVLMRCVHALTRKQVVMRGAELAIDEREERITGIPMHEEEKNGCGKSMIWLFLKTGTAISSVTSGNMLTPLCCPSTVRRLNYFQCFVSVRDIGKGVMSKELEHELWRRAQAVSPMDALGKACETDSGLRRTVSGMDNTPRNGRCTKSSSRVARC